jgi:hypothetical protein
MGDVKAKLMPTLTLLKPFQVERTYCLLVEGLLLQLGSTIAS